jgi:F-type H+-transporting ATPase subunit delta
VSKEANNLFATLLTNKRVDLLQHVASKYVALFAEANGDQTAVVTTAVPLEGELETKVLEKLKSLTGKNVTVKNIIDESIIGGFILRVGDLQYNASVANQLNKLKREFTLN